ncbi:TetR/AcrR family transcriptional regulator [Hoyosella rhizosphaerae]|uniref:TetR family transcriptional regulator n=1 Tax=Hoyosella rhizosphaerae TaxID=1755582 RepID=A0A916UJY7_9ACTN|nr:TetR/AcrR family transcriptional regulator [Hoyosella rhizosphaerae]MBN4925369.1 TetR/AcrR family transcriptional regulator [Hoyosella rhizosphaerae]GGC75765.1 TetR family transcriptional regulator [Hoyosella rhizosphaerae]
MEDSVDSRPTRRVRHNPDERRRQLIGIGLEMLTRRPLHQITIDEVAASAGISRSLLFHYFPTKRDYYAAVIRAASKRLLRAARQAGAANTPEEVVDGYLSFIERRHQPYVALFQSSGSEDWVREILTETRAALVDQLLTVLDLPADATDSVLMRPALGAWLSFAEELALQWARTGVGTRSDILAILNASLDVVARTSSKL